MTSLSFLKRTALLTIFLGMSTLHATTIDDPRDDTLAVTVGAIREIAAVDGTLATSVSTASPDSSENFITYSYTINATRNLQARLADTNDVPAGLEISVNATAPSAGGTSTSWSTLTGTYQNIVTNVPAGVESTIQIQARAFITGSPSEAAYPIDIEIAFD